MRRVSLVLLGSLVACSSSPTASPVTAAFVPGTNVIQVTVRDRNPVRGIQLITPDGRAIQATNLDTDRVVEPSPGPSLGLGIGGFGFGRGGGFGSSVGVGVPLAGGARAVQTTATGTIQVPDGYRAAWQYYRIDVLMGEPPATVSIAAPQPS